MRETDEAPGGVWLVSVVEGGRGGDLQVLQCGRRMKLLEEFGWSQWWKEEGGGPSGPPGRETDEAPGGVPPVRETDEAPGGVWLVSVVEGGRGGGDLQVLQYRRRMKLLEFGSSQWWKEEGVGGPSGPPVPEMDEAPGGVWLVSVVEGGRGGPSGPPVPEMDPPLTRL